MVVGRVVIRRVVINPTIALKYPWIMNSRRILPLQRHSYRNIRYLRIAPSPKIPEIRQRDIRNRSRLRHIMYRHILSAPPLPFNHLPCRDKHLPSTLFEITPELTNVDPPVRVLECPESFSLVVDELTLVLASFVVV